MLYTSVNFAIPDNPRYERMKVHNGSVYLYYRVKSFHENGKKKNERFIVGKVFKDAQTGLDYFCPNDNYYSKILKSDPPATATTAVKGRKKSKKTVATYLECKDEMGFGYMLACHSIIHELQLDEILSDSFGNLSQDIIAVSAFLASGAPGGLSNIDHFTQNNFCFTSKIITSESLSQLYKDISQSMCNDFFRSWIRKCCQNDYICYDVTSVSSYSDNLPFVEWGYNRDKERMPQFNIGMFCTVKSKVPVYYSPYNGSINDYSNLPYVINKARGVGLEPDADKKVTLVMDGGFAIPDVILKASDMGFKLLIGAPQDFGVKIKEHLSEWVTNGFLEDSILRRNDEAIRYKEKEITIGRLRTRLMMFKSPLSGLDQEKSLNSIINQMEVELQDKNKIIKGKHKYAPFFHITTNENNTFTYTFDKHEYAKTLALCGCFALLCTNTELSCEEALDLYRSKDCVEKAFAVLKNDILDERIRTKSIESTNGKMFLAFIGLIIRRTLEDKLRRYLNKSRISLDSAINRLSYIRCIKEDEKWLLSNCLTKVQRELVDILGLPVSGLGH